MDNDTFIVLKGWMINKLRLSGTALILYAVIYGFSQDGKSYFRGSLAYLAACAGVSKRGIQNTLAVLIEKGLIEKSPVSKSGRKYNDYRAVKPDDVKKQAPEKGEEPPKREEKTSSTEEKTSSTVEKTSPHINTYYSDNLAGNPGRTEEVKEREDQKTPPSKPNAVPLVEREPKNDYEAVEKHWQLNYLQLFGELPVAPSWGAIRGRLKQVFQTVSVEKIIQALDTAKEDRWIVENGYSLLKILGGDQLSKLLHRRRSEPVNDWSNFGVKG
jgi:hypothetical protein